MDGQEAVLALLAEAGMPLTSEDIRNEISNLLAAGFPVNSVHEKIMAKFRKRLLLLNLGIGVADIHVAESVQRMITNGFDNQTIIWVIKELKNRENEVEI